MYVVIVCAIIAYFVLLSLDLLACAHRPSIDLYLIKYYYLWQRRERAESNYIYLNILYNFNL